MKGPEDGEAGRHGQQLGWGEQAPGGETESAPPSLARSQHGVNATSVKARKGFKWVSEPLLVPRGPSLKKEVASSSKCSLEVTKIRCKKDWFPNDNCFKVMNSFPSKDYFH